MKAIELYQALFEQGFVQAFDSAIEAADYGIKEVNLQLSTMKLYEILFARPEQDVREKAFASALSIANQMMKAKGMFGPDFKQQEAALRIYEALVKNGYEPAFEPALKAVDDAKVNIFAVANRSNLYNALVEKLKALVRQGKSLAFAKQVVKFGMRHDVFMQQAQALEKLLVPQKQQGQVGAAAQ